MKKICSVCQVEKDIEEFPIHKISKGGRLGKCIPCFKQYTKEIYHYRYKPKKKLKPTPLDDKFNVEDLTLSMVMKEDLKQMYELLSVLGYDPTKDIHKQFNERHGLEVEKKRYVSQQNKWTYDELFSDDSETI